MNKATTWSGLCLVLVVAVASSPASAARATAGEARSQSAKCVKSPVRFLVLISAKTGAVNRSFPDVDQNGTSAVASDGRGGWFIAGGFNCVGSVKAPALVHLDGNGDLDRSWHSGLRLDPGNANNGYAAVTTMAVSGARLYVGGGFGVEALDAATGKRLWLAPIAPIVRDEQLVVALAVNANAVYVGGIFAKIDGKSQPSLAALDPGSGRLLNWHAPRLGPTSSYLPVPQVVALALDGPRLFVGGPLSFGGKQRPQIGVLVAATGRLTSWVPATAPGLSRGSGVGDVGAILVSHGYVFTGGHDGEGITTATTGQLEPAMKEIGGTVFASFGNIAYVGGDCRNSFTDAGGQPRHNLAALNLTTGKVTSWAPNVAPYTCPGAMAANATEVLVAGSFSKTLG